jgi:hypothetical protein
MKRKGRWITVDVSLLNPQHKLHPAARGEKACRALAWIDLLAMAAWRDYGGRNRGEVRVAERFLAKRWNWSRDKVRRFLDELEREGAIVRKPHERPREPTTLIICNYCFYQNPPTTNETANETKVVPIQIQKESPPKITGSVVAESDVQAVFEYWRTRRAEVTSKTKGAPMKLIPKRERAIRGRLAEGYTVEDLKLAIDGCLTRDWHIRNNHTDVELICRDQTKVEQFLGFADDKGGAQGGRTFQLLK